MKRIVLIILVAAGFQLGSQEVKAQIPDSVRYRVQQAHYQRILKIDPAKARKVAEIQGHYQDNLAQVFERFDLNAAGKQQLIKSLDSIRVQKLKLLLNDEQLMRLQGPQR